ncbi:12549_t:CDS:2, partial [Gigaspora margarita]
MLKEVSRLFLSICENVGIKIGNHNIFNYSDHKTAVQVLKELGYSNSIVMSITRHKTQQGFILMSLSEFLSALEIVGKSSNLIDNIKSYDTDNIEPHNKDNIEPHNTDNIEPHNAENTSIRNSFYSAKESL